MHSSRGVPNKRQFILESIRDKIRRENIYTLANIYEYDEPTLDSFIAQNTNNKYENLADKRYITLLILYQANLLNNKDTLLISKYLDHIRLFIYESNNVEELRSKLL